MGAEAGFVDPNEHRGRNALLVGLALAAFYGLMALIAFNNQDSPLSVVLTMPALCLYGFLMLPQVGWGYLAGAVFWFLLGGGLAYLTRKPWVVLVCMLGLWVGLGVLGYAFLLGLASQA